MDRKAFLASLPFLPSAVKAALAPDKREVFRLDVQTYETPEPLNWDHLNELYEQLSSIRDKQNQDYYYLGRGPVAQQIRAFHNGQA